MPGLNLKSFYLVDSSRIELLSALVLVWVVHMLIWLFLQSAR